MAADEVLLTRIRDNYARAEEEEHDWRRNAVTDLLFSNGEGQWDERILKVREADNRPCLTINRLGGAVHRVVNNIRRSKPAATVAPVETGDTDTAEIFSGILRHIHRHSNAPAVRSYAMEYTVRAGIGYYRIDVDWADPMSFDQEISLSRILNPLSVYMDPSTVKSDRSDAGWCFINTYLSEEEYTRTFPNSELGKAFRSGYSATGDREPRWVSADGVTVGEYFEQQFASKTIVLLSDGRTMLRDLVPKEGIVVAERESQVPTLMWYKTNGYEILDKRQWLGRYIPVVTVLGEELVIEGDRRVQGIVRQGRDSQSMYNYWTSAQTEQIALSSKAPWVAAAGQISKYREAWRRSNVRSDAVLEYDPMAIGNVAVPPPQRQTAEPPVQAMAQARQQAADDIKATTSTFDASLGARSNETSGVAIRNRQEEGDVANYHYTDGFETALNHEARIELDLIPKVYNRPGRVVRIIGENGDERNVTLNQPAEDRGVQKIYAVGAGKYDVAVQIGPSVKTQRQEAAQSMVDLTKTYPALMEVAGDLLVENMDWPGAQQIAERLKRLLPPDLQDQEGEKIPPSALAKLRALDEQNQKLTEALQQLSEVLENKKLELESKERIEAQKAEVQLVIKRLDMATQLAKQGIALDSAEATSVLNATIDDINRRQDLLREDEPVTTGKTTSGNGSQGAPPNR